MKNIGPLPLRERPRAARVRGGFFTAARLTSHHAAYLLVSAIVLTGCASPLKSTLTTAATGATAPDQPATILASGEVSSWAKKLQSELQKELKRQPVLQGPVEILPGSQLRLALSVTETFEPQAAQFKVAALMPYAAIAGALRRQPGAVVHVLMYSASDPELEAPLRLGARRVASVHSELSRSGVPLTRLRAESRDLPSGQAERLELILKPVVQGQEALAWVPPENSAAGK